MCGIAGILQFKNKPSDPSVIRRMTESLVHRGPDAAGYFKEGVVAFGHRRLSIIDLSEAANQPFTDHSGRYVVVFNGELYNFMEVRKKIPDYPFHTTSDTEVLIAAYAKWGMDCVYHFRGMFAFAIWDKQENSLFVCRDRMGIKPLYYYQDDAQFLFSSEIRSLLASGLIKRKLDPKALIEYFSYQSVGYPYSMVEGIQQLQMGSMLLVKNGKTDKKIYWDLTVSEKQDFDFSDRLKIQQYIRQLLLQSVQRRMVSDVPVGAFLSGGIDSSAIVGLMSEVSAAKPNTFTISFEEQEYDESAYADIVAKKFNTHHIDILLKPTVFLDELENALNAMDSPTGDGINTYVVSKAVRQKGISVALSGIGGDELFAGYPFFGQYLQLQQSKWLWNLPSASRKLMSSFIFSGNTGTKKSRLQQLLSAQDCSIEMVYPVLRQILSYEQIHKLTHLSSHDDGVTALQQILMQKRENLHKMPLLSQFSAAEYLGYTQHTLLKDTDQMSMAVSLEVREPFFDKDLVEFVLSIPDNMKKPQYPKSLLVESIKPLLPEEIVFRKKRGFVLPWNLWLKNELRSFCEEKIKNIAQRSFINGEQLGKYWERFLKGDNSIRWSEIWLFVVIEHWMQKNAIE